MRRLRIGAVEGADSATLVDGLDLPPWSDRVSLRTYRGDAPLAADLDARLLDFALLSVPRLLERLSNVELVPGLAVTTDGPARFARLVADRPLEDVGRVFARDGASSAALLCRVLFAASGRAIEIDDDAPDHCDARLLEGADASAAPTAGLRTDVDLDAAWTDLTGLPFVWRAWAVVPGLLDRDTYGLLHSARARGVRRGRASVSDARDEAVAAGSPGTVVHRLGRRELASLEFLGRHAARHGLIAQPDGVKFAHPATSGACRDE